MTHSQPASQPQAQVGPSSSSHACRDGGASGPALFTSAEDRTLLLCLLLHSADIGNPLRPGRIARKWAGRVMDEFFAQVSG